MNEVITLSTELVELRPLDTAHTDALQQQADEAAMWQYFTVNLSTSGALKKWIDQALEEQHNGSRIPFTIVHRPTGVLAGSMSIGNISEFDQRAEIGWSWLGKNFRGTDVNRHAKFCMLQYLLEDRQFERVEFKTDVLNERARKGLIKIGATEEGILRSHMKMWNNRRRTSVYYSILREEWPQVKATIFKDI